MVLHYKSKEFFMKSISFKVEFSWKGFTISKLFKTVTEANHFIEHYTCDGKIVAIEVQEKARPLQIFNVIDNK